jgi:hypothetical protein
MESSTPKLPVPLESARALCMGCGGPLLGRQKVACAGKCRAKVSRQRGAAVRLAERWAREKQNAELRALLETALGKLRESGHESSSIP